MDDKSVRIKTSDFVFMVFGLDLVIGHWSLVIGHWSIVVGQ